MRVNLLSGRSLSALNRGFVPSPELSLLVILVAAGIGLAGALIFGGLRTGAAPRFGLGPALGQLLEQRPEAMGLSLKDVLSLSSDFEVNQDRTGAFDNGAAAADWPDAAAARERYQKWGRMAGYQSYLWRPHLSTAVAAPIEIQSAVSLYRTVQGAEDAYRYGVGKLPGPNPTEVSVPSLGDATVAFQSSTGPFTVYLLLVRKGNGVAWLLTTSFAEQASLESAVSLTKTMVERMQ